MSELNPPPRLAVQLPDGETSWFRIIGVEASWNDATTLTIAGGDPLDLAAYRATVVDGDARTAGRFTVTLCISNETPIRFVGSWTPDE